MSNKFPKKQADAGSLALQFLTRSRPEIFRGKRNPGISVLLGLYLEKYRDPPISPLRVVSEIQRGFPGSRLIDLMNLLGITQKELAAFMDAQDKTIRSMMRRKILDETASDKLFRLTKAYFEAFALFDNEEDTLGWLKEPSEALGGAVPFELLSNSAGEALVYYELAQMRYGQPV